MNHQRGHLLQIYLVGGAVRDQLLGLPVQERDWVVVGASPEIMLRQGYRPVGKDFPVFLHAVTHEEYALARTERKTAPGYKGFHFYTSPEVTLEEDLQRRDVTINAMAQAADGRIIDPYDGQGDLRQRILRHVSSAFVEDPVRILRVARFAARFPDFTVHPTTFALMQHMVEQGEVNALVAERVWQELARALKEPAPERFFEVLEQCGALSILFPELKNNAAGMKALQQAVTLTKSANVRLAAYLFSIPKQGITALSQRYRVPWDYTDLAVLVATYHGQFFQVLNLSAEELLKVFEFLDAFRRPDRLSEFCLACTAIYGKQVVAHTHLLTQLYDLVKSVDSAPLLVRGLKGMEMGQEIRKQRINLIREALSK